MKKINKLLNKIRFIFTKYVYTNRLFVSYLILAICGTIIVREVTINGIFSIKPMLQILD